MAIKGSLTEAGLPDVLQLLSLGRKTGRLSVTDRASLGYIFFDQGHICYAAIVNRRDRLGDILVKNGKVSQEQLSKAIDEQSKHGEKKIGEILVDMGAFSREDLEHFMRLQIEDAVFFLFTWQQGNFMFESDVRPEREDFLVSIDPEALLLEGARRVDEWSLIEKKIPSFDLVFRLDRKHLDAAAVSLTEEQQRIINLLDGQNDVAKVIDESGLTEFDAGKALYGFITAGFVHRVGRSTAAARPAVATVRIDEHRNLGIAFYRTGMLDEAMREFRHVVELRPSDGSAYFHMGLIHFKQAEWTEAIRAFKGAAERGGARPSVLYNLGLSFEKAGQLDDSEMACSEAATRARHDPRILTGWGIVALHRNDCEVAAGRLDRAREVVGDRDLAAIWYWARSLAAAGLDQFDEAEQVLREGLERHPKNTVLRNNLAALLELLGYVDESEELLRAALADEPSLPQLSKNLGDLLYRSGRYDDAWEAYQRAVKLHPQLGDDVYFKLGNIAYKRLDREHAAELWQQTLELNPNHELAQSNLETVSALR